MDDTLFKYVELLRSQGESGAYVGRQAPMHLGHQAQNEILTTAFPKRHAIFVGSCAHEISIRHLFSFADRARFIKTVFPDARVVPLPDFERDDDWFHAIETLLELFGIDPKRTVFIGGCDEDVRFYNGRGYKVQIINRFDGTTTDVSGTKVRDSLIHGRSLDGMLDTRIIPLVEETFRKRWAEVTSR